MCYNILSYTCNCACRSTILYKLKYPLGFVLQDGWPPLGVASQNGHLEIVKSLIKAGSNVNHTTKVVKN